MARRPPKATSAENTVEETKPIELTDTERAKVLWLIIDKYNHQDVQIFAAQVIKERE